MTTYNTKNPVPSSDARDRYDNSQVFDELMNGAAPNTPDRLGVLRQSWAGMETEFQMFLANSGLESTHLTYVDGTPLVASRPTQLIDRAGSIYRVKLPASFPVTLTGTWATDQNLLVDVGDAALRASLAASSGSDMVGFIQAGTGAVTRTAQSKMRDTVSVKDFGAVGDGVTDDTAAFNAAISYANSRGGVDYGGVVGTTIFIPDGRYKIGSLNPITRSGCEFVGSSRNGTVLLLTSNVTTFTFGNGGLSGDYVVGGGVSNLKLEYATAPSANSRVFAFNLAYRLKFSDLLLINVAILARLGESASGPCGGIAFVNIDGSKPNVACPLFEVRYGAGLFLTDVHVFVAVSNPVHPVGMDTLDGINVLDCFVGFWDTVQASNCIFERFSGGLAVTAGSGMVYQNMFFSNVIMDYFRKSCVSLESHSGGVVAGVHFDNTSWFASWESNAIQLSGSGYNDNHCFAGKVVIAGIAGVKYSLANAKNVNFIGMQVTSCNRMGIAQGAMIFDANSSGFTVNACRGNSDTTGVGFPWRAPYGINIAANCDFMVVSANQFEGSTAGYSIATNSTASINRIVSGNSGANYAGVASGIYLAASGVAKYNFTSTSVDCYVYGGTVSEITVNGLRIGGATSGCFSLDPGQYISVSYTVAPNFTSVVKA